MSMTEQDEAAQIEQVIERLGAQYPLVARADLELLVHTIHHGYARCRVHDFVPLLVEKAARQIVSRLPANAALRPPGRSSVVVIPG